MHHESISDFTMTDIVSFNINLFTNISIHHYMTTVGAPLQAINHSEFSHA